MCDSPEGAIAGTSSDDSLAPDAGNVADTSSIDVWQLISGGVPSERHGIDAHVADDVSSLNATPALSLHAGIGNELQHVLDVLGRDIETNSLYTRSMTHVSGEDFEVAAAAFDPVRNLETAWNSLPSSSCQHFWETDFWSRIFGTDSEDDMQGSLLEIRRPIPVSSDPQDDVAETGESVVVQTAKKRVVTSFHEVIKNTTVQSWQDERDALWQKAIRRWHALVLSWKQDTNIVQLLAKETGFSKQAQILVDVFYNKAPSTLLKRANSLGRLVNHLALHHELCDEPELYNYLSGERLKGAPATRLQGVVEACRFARHVLGVEALDVCISSRRCAGVVSRPVGKELHQATPLTVDDLKTLHRVLHSDSDLWDKCFVGMVLFCVYARARWTDAQHSEKLIEDRDGQGKLFFIECSTAVHKTARALQMKHMFLPSVAPTLGVCSECWGEPWLLARQTLGCDNLGKYPLMPAPDASGNATIRPVSTEEASDWLEHILVKNRDVATDVRYTSHSFKATMLSFLAKRGVSFEDRLASGYHSNPLRMALTYSRDGASRPLTVLSNMLTEIRDGVFSPDVTRSGRLKRTINNELHEPGTHEKSVEQSIVIEIKEEDEEEGSVHSEHVTTASESDVEEPAVMPRVHNVEHVLPKESVMWQHKKLKTLHVAMEGHRLAFFCGRAITDSFELTDVQHRFDTPRCRQCFNSKLMHD